MNSAELSNEKIKELIFYGLKENGIDVESVRPFKIKRVIHKYIEFCNIFRASYVDGELDTFKRAACLLGAINRVNFSKDKRINASIALDTAYKMCEKPYWNVGENNDIPKKLEEVNFKECFKEDMDTYNQSKNMLIDALVYEKGEPIVYYRNLELFYQVALQSKHDQLNHKSNGKTTTVVKTELTEEEKMMLANLGKFNEEYISPAAEEMANYFTSLANINLNIKVDNFIDWYSKNMLVEDYTDNIKHHKQNDMRNFIEKMAVWYELRYPDYEINRLMPCSSQEEIEVNDVMFNSNKYINDIFDENEAIRILDWAEFYNAKTFINSLPLDERFLLGKAKYQNIVYLAPQKTTAHLHLTSKGCVYDAEYIGKYTKFSVDGNELKGMHVKDVVKLLKEKGISLPSDNELEETINYVEKWNYQREEMLNCVMYRIIERGGNKIGPRRGFLFAKEFGRNINIPMMYGVDYSDPGLRSFIIEYLKAGGSKDLECYVGYFTRTNKNEKMETVSVQDMMKNVHHNCVTKYTPEETELYQRIANAISNQVDPKEVKKEEVKQLRLQRRLDKSRRQSKHN